MTESSTKIHNKNDKKRSLSKINNEEEESNDKTLISNTTITTSTAPTPITEDGQMPQKKFYRSRAHCNPLSHNNSFDYPRNPDRIDWSIDHYPNFVPTTTNTTTTTTTTTTDGDGDDNDDESTLVVPTVLDIGCGFGGLTIALSTLLPHETILGLEIRAKVTEYVRLRILACRTEDPGHYENCSVMRSNTMKFMPNLFHRGSLEKIFLCFPDPHFKKKNHPRRIVSERLLSEYAYFLKPNTGRLYTITDVEDLHKWHLEKCRPHPMFRELTEEECAKDPCVKAMYGETEEGKKVERAGAKKY
eukprot:CAMPEP_0198252920 /NCGR_PEP_ID=MMETSP1447-20131203/3394_1 /TAXON_ID=420782 /ORGANISM="Chaetoceros dichaeta, Strain CCMP1751" /LENGTH=301 /DNA_ID=CAMNT_0043938359 /DNA_START=32 /DNA_END=934 /DNA_ORIENTATION=-